MAWSDFAHSVLEACVTTFGRDVTYRSTQGSQSLKGIFDAAHQIISLQDGLEYSTIKPTLGIRLSDLEASPIQGDEVVIESIRHQVVDIQPDGQGGALLILQKF